MPKHLPDTFQSGPIREVVDAEELRLMELGEQGIGPYAPNVYHLPIRVLTYDDNLTADDILDMWEDEL